jgi:hypothetical protein
LRGTFEIVDSTSHDQAVKHRGLTFNYFVIVHVLMFVAVELGVVVFVALSEPRFPVPYFVINAFVPVISFLVGLKKVRAREAARPTA